MLSDVLQALTGIVAFPLCFFAPGYVVGWLSNVMGFRTLSLPERFLWAVALSGPLSAVLACDLGCIAAAGPILAVFVALALFAAALLFLDLRRARGREEFGREFWIICACMAAVALYSIFETLGIETRHSLYEGVIAADWSVRIPLVEAAIRGRIPPLNPFFAIGGTAPPMRYYYFWYVLCAQVGRLTHIDARACLVASTAWSAYSVIAVTFLYLKYIAARETIAPIFEPRSSQQQPQPPSPDPVAPAELRRLCLVALGLMCVMSLFLLPALVRLFVHREPPLLEIEFWSPDRMPSWLGAMLFAPHHLGGLAFGATGFLLLALLPQERRQALLHALLAAVCFAALAGTSTYLALCFAVAGFFLVLVKLRFRDWQALVMIVLCAAVALLLASPFLTQMRHDPGLSVSQHPIAGAQHSAIANNMFKVVLRSWHFSYGIVGYYAGLLGIPFLHAKIRYIFPLLLLPFLYLMELSFYAFVIWYRAKADLLRGNQTSQNAWLLWALFCGFALPALLLSSEPTQGINDLGRHAGLALRLVLIVWASPIVLNTWRRLRAGATTTRGGRWVVGLTIAGIAIGLGGELWQVTMDRIYTMLQAHRLIASQLLYLKNAPFLEVRDANDWVAAHLPTDAIVQSNPVGFYQPIFLLYLNRQTAAGDQSCEAAFGGNVDLCKAQVAAPLAALFGRSTDLPLGDNEPAPPQPNPAEMTVEDLAATCARLHIATLLVSRDDPAWQLPGTWVWTQPAAYSNGSVRVIACPAQPPRSSASPR